MGSAALTTERFTFVRPASVEDAMAAAAEAGAGGRFWAGGTDLLLEWRRHVRPIGTCIDITGLAELRGLERVERETLVEVAAEKRFERRGGGAK